MLIIYKDEEYWILLRIQTENSKKQLEIKTNSLF